MSSVYHHFHVTCIDSWSACQLIENGVNVPIYCPMCRREVVLQNVVEAYGLTGVLPSQEDFQDSRQSESSNNSGQSRTSAFPIFPAQIGKWLEETVVANNASHLTTSSLAGRLALIIDTGAFTPITGAILARALAKIAKENGYLVEQI